MDYSDEFLKTIFETEIFRGQPLSPLPVSPIKVHVSPNCPDTTNPEDGRSNQQEIMISPIKDISRTKFLKNDAKTKRPKEHLTKTKSSHLGQNQDQLTDYQLADNQMTELPKSPKSKFHQRQTWSPRRHFQLESPKSQKLEVNNQKPRDEEKSPYNQGKNSICFQQSPKQICRFVKSSEEFLRVKMKTQDEIKSPTKMTLESSDELLQKDRISSIEDISPTKSPAGHSKILKKDTKTKKPMKHLLKTSNSEKNQDKLADYQLTESPKSEYHKRQLWPPPRNFQLESPKKLGCSIKSSNVFLHEKKKSQDDIKSPTKMILEYSDAERQSWSPPRGHLQLESPKHFGHSKMSKFPSPKCDQIESQDEIMSPSKMTIDYSDELLQSIFDSEIFRERPVSPLPVSPIKQGQTCSRN